MQTRKRSESALKKQLLQQVTRSHTKILEENSEAPRRTRSSTPKSARPRRRRLEGKKEEPKQLVEEGSIVKGKFFLGSMSLEDDKKLYLEAKHNPAVLAYLKDKIRNSMVYNTEIKGVTLDKSGTLFVRSQLLKSDKISKNDDNGQMKDSKLSPQKPNAIEDNVPDPTTVESLSPTFGSLVSQKKSVKESLIKSNAKSKIEKQNTLNIEKKRKIISNSLCLKILIINLAFFALTIWPIMSAHPITVDAPQIAMNITNEKEKSSDPKDRLQDLNIEFQKMNQELESVIAKLEKPEKAPSSFQDFLPLSVIFLCLQVLVWGTYLSLKL